MIDEYKNSLASKHGFKVIRIDCNYKNDRFNYIKNNIIESELKKYVDLNHVNWKDINKKASSNKIKIACSKYNEGMLIKDIANELKVSTNTIRDYLRKGRKLKWCNYDPSIGRKRKIQIVETGDVFNSIKECIDKSFSKYGVKFEASGIYRSFKNGTYKGYTFKYID